MSEADTQGQIRGASGWWMAWCDVFSETGPLVSFCLRSSWVSYVGAITHL